jgi:hypothetical protein
MIAKFFRRLWILLHRRTIFVAVKQTGRASAAAAQPPQRNDDGERLTAARSVH